MGNSKEGTVWSVSAGVLAAATTKLWNDLGERGAGVVTHLNDDDDYRRRVKEFMLRDDFDSVDKKATTSLNPQWLSARAIMSSNFFGVEEAIQHFGVNPSPEQLSVLSEVPFTEAALQSHKNTHVLVAVFPLSILDIRNKVERKLFYCHEDTWYNKEEFAKDKGEAGWQMVRKTPVPSSTNKTWAEQQVLLAPDETTPTARVMAYTIIGHFKATGERLFENIYVRCSNTVSYADHARLGRFGRDGLSVDDYWVGVRGSDVGLSSSLKFKN